MYYVYILKSQKDKKLYIGYTNDLRRRLKEHNEGKTFSTSYRTPFDIVYYEAYRSSQEAHKRESNLKLRSNAFNQLKRRIVKSITG